MNNLSEEEVLNERIYDLEKELEKTKKACLVLREACKRVSDNIYCVARREHFILKEALEKCDEMVK